MGTRHVIANPLDNGFTGRYVHWDGSPQTKVPQLLAIVAEKGLEWTRKTIVEDYRSWSSIGYPLSDDGLPGNPHTDTAEGDDSEYRYTKNDFTGEFNGIEWVYILNDRQLSVMQPTETGLDYLGGFAWDAEPSEEAIAALECGEKFERCGHYAWAHASSDEEREAMGDLGMGKWLGTDPLGFSDAIAIHRNGQVDPISRSGGIGSAQRPMVWDSKVGYWWGSYKSGGNVRLGRRTKTGYKLDVDLVMPATKLAPSYIVPAGTILA